MSWKSFSSTWVSNNISKLRETGSLRVGAKRVILGYTEAPSRPRAGSTNTKGATAKAGAMEMKGATAKAGAMETKGATAKAGEMGRVITMVFANYASGPSSLEARTEVARNELEHGEAIARALQCTIQKCTDIAPATCKMTPQDVKNWLKDQSEWFRNAEYVVVIAAGYGHLGGLVCCDGGSIFEKEIETIIEDAVGSVPKIYFYQKSQVRQATPMDKSVSQLQGGSKTIRFYPTADDCAAARTWDSRFLKDVRDIIESKPRISLKEMAKEIDKRFDNFNNQVPQIRRTNDADLNWCFP